MSKGFLKLFAAACLFASVAALPASAQDKMGKMDKKPMDQGKMKGGMVAGKTVYACTDCKMYFSSADAKKMGYKDSMGHKLKKMTKVPSGYKMGHMEGAKMKSKM